MSIKGPGVVMEFHFTKKLSDPVFTFKTRIKSEQ